MSRAPIPPIPFNPFMGSANKPINQIARQVSELASMTSPDGIAAQRGPLGTTFMDHAPSYQEVSFYAVLVNGGPPDSSSGGSTSNQPDFTDARYWLRAITIMQGQSASATDLITAYMDPSVTDSDSFGNTGYGLWVVATNLQESLAGTHLLPVISCTTSISTALPVGATIVRVTQQGASKITALSNDYGNSVFTFLPITNAAASNISFLITGNATGQGKYVGKTFVTPPTGVNPASNLASADFGTLAGSANALILNPPELAMSASGHDVTGTANAFSLYGCGSLLCVNSDGTMVLVAQMFYAACS